MAEPEAVWRAMTSGSRSRYRLRTVAGNLILPTIAILGPARSLRDMHTFIDTVGHVGSDISRMARFDLVERADIIEIREPYDADSLYSGTKYRLSPDHEEAYAVAQADTVRILGHEVGRDVFARMVELQVESDVAHRRLELSVRDLRSQLQAE